MTIAPLPPEHYRSPSILEREQAAIFRRGWQLAGLAEDVAQHGRFLCTEIGGRSVVVQNFDGDLRAFHNVCTHRGTQLRRVESTGEGPLRCPYHGWTFDGGGVPVGIPARDDFEIDPASRALTPWKLARLGPLLFVSQVADPPELATALLELHAPIAAQLDAADALLVRTTTEVRANWKVVIENGLESYHVPLVHPSTIAPHGVRELETRYAGPSSLSRFTAETGRRARAAIDHALPGRPRAHGDYHHALVFPNVTIAEVYGAFFMVTRAQPLSATSSRLHNYIFCTRHEPIDPTLATLVQRANVEFIQRTYLEDAAICETAQRGLDEATRPSVLGKSEQRVLAFQRGCADALEKEPHA